MDVIRMLLENALESQAKAPFDQEKFFNLYHEHHGDMMMLHQMKDSMNMFPKSREHMMHDYHDHLEQAAKSHAQYHAYVTKYPKEVEEEVGFPSKPHNFVDALKHTENAWQAGQEAGNERQWDAEHESYMDSHPQ